MVKSLTLHSATESFPGLGGITAPSAGTINVASDYKFDLNLRPSYALDYKPLSAKFGGVGSGTWNLSGTTGSLSAGSFDSGFAGTFGGINKFNVKTDFSGSLTAGSLGTATIGRNMIGGTVDLTNPYAANAWNAVSFHVGNYIESSKIISDGNLGNVSTMYTYYSQIAAGVNSSYVFGKIPTPTDYTSYSTIKSFTSDCPSHHNIHFVGSTVGSYDVANLHIGTIDTENGGSPLGFVGYQMNRVSVRLGNKVVQLDSLSSQATLYARLAEYALNQGSLGDLEFLFPG